MIIKYDNIVRLISLIIFLFYGSILCAQSNSELLFFNSEGHIVLIRGDNVIKKIQGESFLQDDVLKIIGGNVTIINLNNKRITVKEPGTYYYYDISARMQHAESSLSNRYFVYVWKKMSKEDKQESQPGGVIRGDEFLTSPRDSIIVLSDTIKFCFQNESDGDFDLIIKSDDHKLVAQYPVRNVVSLSIHNINNGKPGKYYWEVKFPFGRGPDAKYFIIPDSSTYNKKINEYNEALLSFSVFDNKLKNLLIEEYMKYNKIYL